MFKLIENDLLAWKNSANRKPLSYEAAALYYWERDKKNSQAEIDYIINIGPDIYPIEVKAGKTGHLKSLHLFLQEKYHPEKRNIGICISEKTLRLEKFDQYRILYLPLYMIHELPRLLSLI